MGHPTHQNTKTRVTLKSLGCLLTRLMIMVQLLQALWGGFGGLDGTNPVMLGACGPQRNVSVVPFLSAIGDVFSTRQDTPRTDAMKVKGIYHFTVPKDTTANRFQAAETIHDQHPRGLALRVRLKDRSVMYMCSVSPKLPEAIFY